MSLDCKNGYKTPCPDGCGACGLPYAMRPGAREYRVTGTDRAAGSLGVRETFQIVVTAAFRDAPAVALDMRYAAGREHVHVYFVKAMRAARPSARPSARQSLAECDGMRGLLQPEA